jgi:hypothetical protein
VNCIKPKEASIDPPTLNQLLLKRFKKITLSTNPHQQNCNQKQSQKPIKHSQISLAFCKTTPTLILTEMITICIARQAKQRANATRQRQKGILSQQHPPTPAR